MMPSSMSAAVDSSSSDERARCVPVEDEIAHHGTKPKPQDSDHVGQCPVCEHCSICGCAPCGTPGFCQMCREADRKLAARRRHERTKERTPTPQSTIEAILHCVRT
jgi:hypothetical protein